MVKLPSADDREDIRSLLHNVCHSNGSHDRAFALRDLLKHLADLGCFLFPWPELAALFIVVELLLGFELDIRQHFTTQSSFAEDSHRRHQGPSTARGPFPRQLSLV